MISPKKLMKMAGKWQKLAAIRQRGLIPFPRLFEGADSEKGHFVVYTSDKKRFILPLMFLKNGIVKELFRLAEEEFGLPSDGPLTLPCDAMFMEYAIDLIRWHVAKDLEKALLMSMATGHCLSSPYLLQDHTNQQSLIPTY